MTEFIKQRQAATELGVSVRTLQRWSASGYFLKPIRLGGRVVYDRSALEDWKHRLRRSDSSHATTCTE
ncbi:helix-turn-helix transcriptional regulator [Corynebacterium dentalis]|uniref:helix-turn-helix transcriptional regulator n=1 Tax=Corynebacterium dentalis TaxID=2014528 RepID=UPI0028A20C26|nr:helix-turn-helix domain-containing protein [Corynebacterium dentalis]